MSLAGSRSRWKKQEAKHTSIPLGNVLPLRDDTAYDTRRIKLTRNHIVAAIDNEIHVYFLPACKLVRTLTGFQRPVSALDVYHETETGSETLVAASWDNTISVWDLGSGLCVSRAPLGAYILVDGSFSLFILEPKLVEAESGGVFSKERWPKEPLVIMWKVRSSAFRLYELPWTTGRDSTADTGRNSLAIRSIQTHKHAIFCLDAKGKKAVTGSIDCTVRVWDVITGECEWCFIGHRERVVSVRASEQDVYSMSMYGSQGTLRIWNLQTGECTCIIDPGTSSFERRLGLSPKYLAYPLKDRSLHVWDTSQGQEKYQLSDILDMPHVWHHDDQKIVIGSQGCLQVLDVNSGGIIQYLLRGTTKISLIVYWVHFMGSFCVAVVSRDGEQSLEVWEFADEDILRDEEEGVVEDQEIREEH